MPVNITSITPNAFGDGSPFTVAGTGFGTTPGTVTIGGVTQTVNSWGDTTILCTAIRGAQNMGAATLDVVASTASLSLAARAMDQTATNGGTLTIPRYATVLFDLSESTMPGVDAPFIQLFTHHDYGYATPTTPGYHTQSGKPRGSDIGGLIRAHTYLTAGTYTYTVRAKVPGGAIAEAYCTVIVQEPADYFTNVVAINPATSTWPTWASDTLYTLPDNAQCQAKGDLNIAIGATASVNNVWIMGNPSAPAVVSGGLNVGRNNPLTANITEPYNIGFIGFTGVTTLGMDYGRSVNYHAVSGQLIEIAVANHYPTYGGTNFKRPSGARFSQCTIVGGASGSTPLFCGKGAEYLGIVDCNIDKGAGGGTTPISRIQSGYKSVIAHCKSWGADGQGHNYLTVRARGAAPWVRGYDAVNDDGGTVGVESEYVVVADNTIGDVTDPYDVGLYSTIVPINSSAPMYVSNVAWISNEYNTPAPGNIEIGGRLIGIINCPDLAAARITYKSEIPAHYPLMTHADFIPVYSEHGFNNGYLANERIQLPAFEDPGKASIAGGDITLSLVARSMDQTVGNAGTLTIPRYATVQFDLTGTTATETDTPFVQLFTHHDYGYATPTTPGSHTQSGKPRGNDVGGLIRAHTYLTAGTYQYTVRVKKPGGGAAEGFINVVVQEPADYFTNVVAIDPAAPSWPAWQNDTLYTLPDNANCAGKGLLNIATGNPGVHDVWIVGNPNAPAIVSGNVTVGRNNPGTASIVESYNIGFVGLTGALEIGVDYGRSVHYYAVSATHMDQATLSHQATYGGTNFNRPSGVAFSRCNVEQTVAGAGNPYFTFLGEQYTSVIDCSCDFGVQGNGGHVARPQGLFHCVFAHNKFFGITVNGAYLTVRPLGTDAWVRGYHESLAVETAFVVVGDNIFGDAADPYQTAFPTSIMASAGDYRRASDVLWVSNTYARESATITQLAFAGKRLGVTNCVNLIGSEVAHTTSGYTGDAPSDYIPCYSDVGFNGGFIANQRIQLPAFEDPGKAGT